MTISTKTCESCRRKPGTRKVKLGGVTFVVCSGCAPMVRAA